ncbi:hypothetical protein GXM_04143 [Nostoc sphaeroides CCNUC1]|uniref:Uncharacterized protein n=1 Tax=Nostoc sphaeroides CCNUC1 TaxID=2653204 RepID=A0A5P8W1X9_9NOSO|nr:hypothetical protein GXM_04143 [Nostoc sphaeroides CCNUC1]
MPHYKMAKINIPFIEGGRRQNSAELGVRSLEFGVILPSAHSPLSTG